MIQQPTQPPAQDPNAVPPPDESAEGIDAGPEDMTGGYVVTLTFLPDGTIHVQHEAHAASDAPDGEVGESFTNIGDALKAVIRIAKDNPLSQDEQANFEAGYQEGQPARPVPRGPQSP